ncbi:N-acetyl-D-Glu racemase DgcA [Phenylobacterium sp.]|uniref:N-acetyl-D-Glu racemase DgcA n=1 Tax=Phenylobacterium sp. TaxID=1871053 RepID=UPI00272FC1A8|nr:N-acetyl-D-Glu racemase DgcA [Phenylobacterium sp.]MDP2212703.1 enolase C-terminal domain-like protein [Phenylobacterium sp.]
MLRNVSVRAEHWPLSTPFRISRGVKTAADVVAVTLIEDGRQGRGEGVPYARYGETIESVLAQVNALGPDLARGLTRRDLADRLGPGAARNAIDCALWDLEARLAGRAVAETLGQSPLLPLVSALTVSLDVPQAMGEAAARMTGATLIKVKVDQHDPAACLAAVRAAAPDAALIVDPNESWTIEILARLQPVLRDLKVALIEQPLSADEDSDLVGFESCAPICADESCHVAADLPGLKDRYQVVNIKLDKTGGLTEALDLLAQARAMDFGVMVGCMVSSSMSIAPAFHVARHADFVDLDGPTWLANDYAGGAVQRGAELLPPDGLWGVPDAAA